MACGTPVIAFPKGAVPEVIDEGVTGFLCNNIDEAVAAAKRLASFDRERCRRQFEARFAIHRMAQDYVRTFECLITAGVARGRH